MKLLLVDDEPLARARLRRLLEERSDCTELREAANGAEAIIANAEFEPDVILLDIRMPGMDGIEAARHLTQGEHPPAIIFCTAFEEYAVAAFESRAVGYLLKPVLRDKLGAALDAARATTRYQMNALARETREQRRFLSVRSAAGTNLLPVAEVRLLLADQKYVTALHPGGSLLLDESLRELELEFKGQFLRVHRKALVAIRHIRGLIRQAGAELVQLDGLDLRVQVSRRHLAEVRAVVAGL